MSPTDKGGLYSQSIGTGSKGGGTICPVLKKPRTFAVVHKSHCIKCPGVNCIQKIQKEHDRLLRVKRRNNENASKGDFKALRLALSRVQWMQRNKEKNTRTGGGWYGVGRAKRYKQNF